MQTLAVYFSRLFYLCDIEQATNLFRIRCFYLSLAELGEEKMISLGWSEKALGKRLDFSLALKGTSGWLHQCSWLSTQQCSLLFPAGHLKVGKPWWRLPRRESYWVKTKLALLIAIWPACVPGPAAPSLVLFSCLSPRMASVPPAVAHSKNSQKLILGPSSFRDELLNLYIHS